MIDVSCSMGWDDGPYTDLEGNRRYGDRMTRAKCELSRSILGLAENFEFNIIGFDCNTRQWQRGMQPADDGHKSAAVGWVGSLRPDGATGTGPATAQALRSEPENLTVVLLTDGAPNCGANGSGATGT